MSVFNVAPTKTNTRTSEWNQSIDLTDNTTATGDREVIDENVDESVLVALKRTGSRLNPTKLREEVARRKYANYSERRYAEQIETRLQLESRDQADVTGARTSVEDVLQRGRQKVKRLLDTRGKLRAGQVDDTTYDTLYENQRGSWFFGIPKYSSKSLLNFDPPAWTNSLGEPSGVDITNAQLPDPSWQWMWKTWYVDMSSDVDEQGWQYSIIFNKRASWHGNHPWFHSWVRRRKWIRKRTRGDINTAYAGMEEEDASASGMHAHHLNDDYFSVRPAKGTQSTRPSSNDPATIDNLATERPRSAAKTYVEGDVNTIPILLEKLRECTMDREKISLVLQYMDEDAPDINYLADEMPSIVSMLIYQHSRRELIASMLKLLDDHDDSSSSTRDQAGKSGNGSRTGKIRGPTEERHEHLLRAIKAADKEFENMEYWSDIREAEQRGESTGTAEKVIESDPPAGPESNS